MRKYLIISLLFLLTACLQPPNSPPTQQPTQDENTNIETLFRHSYVNTLPGVVFYTFVPPTQAVHAPLNPNIVPHIAFFKLDNNRIPTGQSLGARMSVGDGIRKTGTYTASLSFDEYSNTFGYGQPIRAELRSQNAQSNQPACKTQQPNTATGCLGFFDFQLSEDYSGYKRKNFIFLAPLGQGFGEARYLSSNLRIHFHISPNLNNHQPSVNMSMISDNWLQNERIYFNASEDIVFEAEASDHEDADIESRIIWESNIDGNLGTGKKITTRLSVGTHRIFARAIDSAQVETREGIIVKVYDAGLSQYNLLHGWSESVLPNKDHGQTQYHPSHIATNASHGRFLIRGQEGKTFLHREIISANFITKACLRQDHLHDNLKRAMNGEMDIAYLYKDARILFSLYPKTQQSFDNPLIQIKINPLFSTEITSNNGGTRSITPSSCYLIEKAQDKVSVYHSNQEDARAVTKENSQLVTTYTVTTNDTYVFAAGLDTTDTSVARNSQADITISIEEPDPVDVVEASIDFNIDNGVAGEEFDFNAAGSQGTGLTYQWNFGDGQSSDKSFARHIYTTPGKYDVSLTVTNSVGRTNTFTDTVYIFPAVENVLAVGDSDGAVKLSSASDLSVTFNLGTSFDGFRYKLDFGDSSSHNGSGGVVSHKYEKPGTYTYKLEIFDERPAASRSNNHEVARQSTSTLPVYSADRWFTLFGAPVKAEFSMQNLTNGANDGKWYGPITPNPLKIRFDASQSEGTGELKYNWQFSDGGTASGKLVVHEFSTQGLHLVTLTVEDELGYKEQYRQFVRTRTFNPTAISSNIRFYYTYPNQQSSIQSQSLLAPYDDVYAQYAFAEDVSGLLALDDFALDVIGNPDVTANTALQTQALTVWKEYHPYVVYNNPSDPNMDQIKMSNLIIDHRDFDCRDNKYNNPGTYVAFYDVSINGLPLEGFQNYIPLVTKTATHLNPNLPDLCKGVLVRFPKIRELMPKTSPAEIRVATLLQDIRYEVNHFAGLRVPRVSVAILPDVFLDGKEAKPGIAEYTFQNGSEKELMMLVQARKSHIVNGKITLEIPVYAVDKDGKYLPSANGYFNASFLNVESNCGDCVMVNGRSTIKVKLDIPADIQPDVKKPITFDLTKIELSRDGTCTADASEGPKLGAFLSYCAVIDTSYAVPENPPTFEPYPYTTPTAAKFRSGEITFPDPAGNFVKYVRENPQVFMIDVALNCIPFYGIYESGKDFMDAVNKIGTGEASFSEIGSSFTLMLIGAGTEVVGVVGDAISIASTVNRVASVSADAARVARGVNGTAGSRSVNNVFNQSIREILESGTPDVSRLTNELNSRHPNYLAVARVCERLSPTGSRISTQGISNALKELSPNCLNDSETIITALRNKVGDSTQWTKEELEEVSGRIRQSLERITVQTGNKTIDAIRQDFLSSTADALVKRSKRTNNNSETTERLLLPDGTEVTDKILLDVIFDNINGIDTEAMENFLISSSSPFNYIARYKDTSFFDGAFYELLHGQQAQRRGETLVAYPDTNRFGNNNSGSENNNPFYMKGNHKVYADVDVEVTKGDVTFYDQAKRSFNSVKRGGKLKVLCQQAYLDGKKPRLVIGFPNQGTSESRRRTLKDAAIYGIAVIDFSGNSLYSTDITPEILEQNFQRNCEFK